MLFGSVIKLDQFEVITPQQEYDLAVKYYETGSVEAAKKLTLGHLKFVAHISHKYNTFGFNQSDLFQEGCMGLMKAIKHFNPYKGIKLITFASYWIRAEIHEYILKNWQIVKIATTKVQRNLFFTFNKQLEKARDGEGKVDYTTLAKKLDVKESDIREMENRLANPVMQLEDYTQGAEGTDDRGILNKTSADPAEVYENHHDNAGTKQALLEAMQTLDERSLDVVKKRWLNDKKVPLRELSKQYGVSMERIRQIESEAFNKIRPLLPYHQ